MAAVEKRTALAFSTEVFSSRWVAMARISLVIDRNLSGKPLIQGVEFNFSHRAPWCAVAMSEDSPVGVDVELLQWRDGLPVPNEAGAMATYFRWHTRLEAAVKACGMGVDDRLACLERVKYETREHEQVVISVATLSLAAPIVDWRALPPVQ